MPSDKFWFPNFEEKKKETISYLRTEISLVPKYLIKIGIFEVF